MDRNILGMEIAATLYKYMDMETKTIKEEYFSKVAQDIVKLFPIPDVSNQRELLLDFMTYVSPKAYATHSKVELVDNYLSSNSC